MGGNLRFDRHAAVLLGPEAGNRPAARRRQRAALIRLKLRSSAQTEGVGKMRARNPNCPFSPWEKAGMRASGGRAPTGFDFTHDEVRLPQALTRIGSNSQSPHPCLLPGGEGAIRVPIPHSPQPFCLRRGTELQADQGRALSERSEFARTPPEASTTGCPQRSAGTQTVGSPFFCLLFFGEAKKSESPPGDSRPAQASKSNPRPIEQQTSPGIHGAMASGLA